MRISPSTKVRAEKARELYQQNGNLSATARELGIHRSTLDRWQKEGLLDGDSPVISTAESPELGLDQLVTKMITKALKVLDDALEGEKITPAQIRAAIEVTKASNSLRAQAKAEEAKVSLSELIAEEQDAISD